MPAAGEEFVGRKGELAHLAAALAAARTGSGRLVLLSGEPGIGKTRTAAEFAREAEAAGALMLWGRCHQEPGAPPYWPWTQVLRGLAAALDDAALAEDLGEGAPDILDLIPELRSRLPGAGPPLPPGDAAQARFRLFASLSRFLLAAARRRPVTVALDDAHWADAPSLRFLRFVAQDLGSSGLLLIVTYRENALSRQHPLSDALADLARAPGTSRLRLAGLAPEEVGDLMAQSAGAAPPPGLVRALHAQTEGNPLFLREIIRFLGQQGVLGAGAAGMTLPPSLRIPEGVREVIGQRLNLLSAECNAVLRVASVIGREFSPEVLRRACGEHAEAVAGALDDALDARIVEEIRPDRLQFTHAMIRMTLYDELRTGERRRLHRAVGEALEALHRRDLDPVLPELARHFHQAGGDATRAIDYAVRAGLRADAALAFEDAAGLFQAALDLLDQQEEPDPRRRCELLLRLGESQRKANDFDQARGTFGEAVELARRGGFPDLLADAALGVELATWRGGYVRRSADGLLREAITALPESEMARRIKSMGALARAQLYARAEEEAKAIALQAVALARELGEPAVTAHALSILIEFPAAPEETLATLAAGREMAVMARRAGNPELEAQALFHSTTHCIELGRMEEAAEAFAALRRVNQSIRQPAFFLYEIGLSTALALMRGDLAEAERQILSGMRMRTPHLMYSADPLSVLIFMLRREQDRLHEVAPLINAVLRPDGPPIWRPGLALLQVELGRLEEARALFEAMAVDDFAALPRDGRWTTCLAFLSEACAVLDDAAGAAVLHRLMLPRADRLLVFGNGAGWAGAADRFLGLLAATMRRSEEAERHFADAEAVNARCGALAPLAHTRFDRAAMLLRRDRPGDRARAEALLRQVLESAEALGLVALARRARGLLPGMTAEPDPDALTARELEVLRLIAIGRTNADIALVLGIEVTTVATHVRSIFAKTGCANRTEAAAHALRRGLGAAG